MLLFSNIIITSKIARALHREKKKLCHERQVLLLNTFSRAREFQFPKLNFLMGEVKFSKMEVNNIYVGFFPSIDMYFVLDSQMKYC